MRGKGSTVNSLEMLFLKPTKFGFLQNKIYLQNKIEIVMPSSVINPDTVTVFVLTLDNFAETEGRCYEYSPTEVKIRQSM